MVLGAVVTVTAASSMYQCADTESIAFGFGRVAPIAAPQSRIRIYQQRIHRISVTDEQRWHPLGHYWFARRYAAFCAWPGITPICFSMPMRS